MKNRVFLMAIVFIVYSIRTLFAQTDFSGTASIAINANVSDSDSYGSLLNPGNILEITDISMSPSLVAKFNAGDDKTTFSAWVSLKEYPAGTGLLAAAYGSTDQTGAVTEFLDTTGTNTYVLDLMRLRVNVYLTDSLALEVGRQSMLTGYGYGWNPIDFADPMKDPRNPDAEMEGVDAAVLKMYLGSTLSLNIYTLFPRDFLSEGLSYRGMKPGAELTVSLPGVEWKLAGIWDYDSAGNNDLYTPAAGAALNFDLFGIAFYGEASARKGSRRYFADGTVDILTRKTDWLFSALAGLQYTFKSEGNMIIEYFYNGEGYDKRERTDYEKTVTALSVPTVEILKMYTPGYFARQYTLLTFIQPFFDIKTTFSLSVLYSPDSAAFLVMPLLTYTFSGSFEMDAGYTGMFDFSDDDFNEVSAAPVCHMIKVEFSYSF